MDADQEVWAVKEFGVSIPYSGSDDDPWGVMQSLDNALVKARNAAMDEEMARTWHILHGSTEQLGCWYCSWQYRFWKFWQEIALWSSPCEGCNNVMYLCGQACEFWEYYD